MKRRTIGFVAVAAVLALVAAACGGGEEEAPEGGGAQTVNVELKDFSITLDASSAQAGSVHFVVENAGPSEHEFVVLKTDLAPGALPVKEGKVEEEASGIEEIGEIEEFEAGRTESATYALSPGKYVFICNIPGHYPAGMFVGFEVA